MARLPTTSGGVHIPNIPRSKRFNDCGLSSSLYQACYPDSLMDNVQRASACSIQDVDHSMEPRGSDVKSTPVTFYIGEDEEEVRSCYEEECHFGLQRLLTHSLLQQIRSLFRSALGPETSVLGIEEMLPAVVQELLHLSEDEPYGVRGASLILVLEKPAVRASVSRKSSVMSTASSGCSYGSDEHHQNEINQNDVLGTVKLSSETVTTFELILTIREERNLGVSIRNWMANVFKSNPILMIDPKFSLRKRKLYRGLH